MKDKELRKMINKFNKTLKEACQLEEDIKKMIDKFNKSVIEACQLKENIMNYIGTKYNVKPIHCRRLFGKGNEFTICTGIDEDLIEDLENGNEDLLNELRKER